MARPTKQQQEERKKYETVLKRDIEYYQKLEQRCRETADGWEEDCFIPYCLWIDAVIRYECSKIDILYFIEQPIPSHRLNYFNTIYSPLFHLGEDIHVKRGDERWTYENKNYEHLPIDKEKAIDILKCKDLIKNGKLSISIDNLPIINTGNHCLEAGGKSALIALDFTKPIKELLAIVSKIKKDFEDDYTIIKGLDEYLGLVPAKEPYMCNLKECEIYKHKPPKPLEGRLVDALFIFDCKTVGLTKDYAMNEINRYWNDVKKIHTEKITKNTHREYLNFAKKLIKEYGEFT